jgi:hypothetical protein
MASLVMRLDRAIRTTVWNHQTCSLIVAGGRLYVIRTGVLAAAATGSTLGEGWSTFVDSNPILDHLAEAAAKSVDTFFNRLADKAARKMEARLSIEPLDLLATGWMSKVIPLADITSASTTRAGDTRHWAISAPSSSRTKLC